MNSDWFPSLSDAPRVAASGLCKAYRRVPVLYPISFELGAGDVLALLGANGSGKTTVLRLVAGLTTPSGGLVEASHDLRSASIGFVGHDTHLYEDLTAVENLTFATKFLRRSVDEVAIGTALEVVGMRSHAHERIRTYSAGMKRRICLARILLIQPELVLLDEPHASLDSDGMELVDTIIRSAQGSGRVVIVASHDRERVVPLATQVVRLDAGVTTFQGPAASLPGSGLVVMEGGR